MMKSKRWYILFIIPVLTIMLTGCFGDVKTKKESGDNMIHHIEIEIEKYGIIKAELDGNSAPITVENFINLAKSGFYDGLTFHRNIEGFMMQGGDPTGTGRGGSDKTIKGEFSANGVLYNNIKHERGAISMARNSVSMDSASSQFFIVQKTHPNLDGNYAAFGHVTEGIEIVDKILAETKVEDDNGTTLKENQPVITRITVVD